MTIERVKECLFSDEGSFAEAVDTFSDHPPVIEARFDPPSDRQTDRSYQSRLAARRPGFLMPRSSGTFEMDVLIPGAMVNTESGALVSDWFHKLVGDGLGGADLTEVGGTASAGATATSLPFAAATLVRGGGVRIGQKGDGRGDGQLVVVGSPFVTPATLLTAAHGVPNNGDKIRACKILYPKETLGTTKRFLLGFTGAGQQWVARGCQLESMTIRARIGTVPEATLRYRVAYWDRITFGIPSAVALADCKAQIISAGRFFLQTVGTATAALENAAEFTVDIAMALAEQPTNQPTARQLQTVGGYERSQFDVGLTITIPRDAGTKETEYDSDGSATTYKHFLAGLGVGDGSTAGEGRSVAVYLPNIFPSGKRPTYREFNGMVYMDVSYLATEGPDTTNDLTRSVLRIFRS